MRRWNRAAAGLTAAAPAGTRKWRVAPGQERPGPAGGPAGPRGRGRLAQLAERWPHMPEVTGSSPVSSTTPDRPRPRRSWTLPLLLLLAAGCGAGVSYGYAKPGVTAEQAARDERECEDLSVQVLPAAATVGTYRRLDANRFHQCMRLKGYRVVSRDEIERGQTP